MNNKHPNSRLRFWTWLGVWSVLVAAVAVCLEARAVTYDAFDVGVKMAFVRLGITFVITAISILLLSYLGIRAWRNRPTNRRMWFWVGVASVAFGILLSLWQILADMTNGQAYTPTQALFLLLIWSVIFLAMLVFLFSCGKFFRWLFSWRIVKRGLLVLATLTVLIAAFYVEENWRGKRAWDNYRREWEAKGEKFELISFTPPAVPDEQNFAMAPIVVSSYAGRLNKRDNEDDPTTTTNVNQMAMELQRTNLIFNTNVTIGSWQRSRLTDLKPWQDYYRTKFVTNDMMSFPSPMPGWPPPENIDTNIYTNVVVALDALEFPIAAQAQSPAADVLLALSRYAPAIEELRVAGARPYSRFPVNYQLENPSDISLCHFGSLKPCAIVLQLRAIAELQDGQTELALADVKLMLRLAESVRSEPFLISQLVRMAIINLALQPVWEGLAERRWSEAQMQELNRELQKLDSISDFKLCLRGELAYGLGYIEFARKHRGEEVDYFLYAVWPKMFQTIDTNWRYLPDLPRPLARILEFLGDSLPDEFISRCVNHLPPDGWYEQNKVALAKLYREKLFPIAQPEKHLIDLQAVMEMMTSIEKTQATGGLNPQNVLALMVLPTMDSAAQRVAAINNAVDLANVACALERYHLAHGEYPETLVALVPLFMGKIPPDVVNGQQLHYRQTSDRRFLLYSTGWNGKDDGGVAGLNDYGRVDFKKGDWVWQYPLE